jgi:hypothetical protein
VYKASLLLVLVFIIGGGACCRCCFLIITCCGGAQEMSPVGRAWNWGGVVALGSGPLPSPRIFGTELVRTRYEDPTGAGFGGDTERRLALFVLSLGSAMRTGLVLWP